MNYRFYRDRDGVLCRRAVLDEEQRLFGACQILWPEGRWVYYTINLAEACEIDEARAQTFAAGADLFTETHGPSGDHEDDPGPEADPMMGWREAALYEGLRELERSAKEENRELTIEEAERVAALVDRWLAAMRSVYDDAWRRALRESRP